METMKVDEKVILNAFGVRDIEATIAAANDQLLPNEKAHKTTVLYEDLWRDVDSTTLAMLKTIYSIDLKLFSYPEHPLG